MKKHIGVKLFFALIALIVLPVVIVPNTIGNNNDLQITYHGPLNDISVKGSHLVYSWHATPPDAGNIIGPQQYIGKSAEKTLSPLQLKEFKKWFNDFHIIKLKNPDFIGNIDSPLYSYRHRLSINIEDTKLTLSWTGASTWKNHHDKNKIEKAIDELKRLCLKFIKDGNLLN